MASLVSLALVSMSRAMNVETVLVGNPGNAADTTGVGAVPYEYRIGKYEVTNAQYAEFLNAVDANGTNILALYDGQMTTSVMGGIEFSAGSSAGSKYSVKSGRGNNPVGFVSWYDAIRLANWINNGQGSADTENGAYTLGLLGPDAVPVNGSSIARNSGAIWFLPNDNEWYKAAYHQPFAQGGDGDDYWAYPTRTNETPFSAPPPGTAAPLASNTANYFYDDLVSIGYNDGFAVTGSHVFDPMTNYHTDVGAYLESSSYYGTFDQAGNAYEWNERPYADGVNRELRGSSWAATGFFDPYYLSASSANGLNPATGTFGGVAFRLATVPEPASAAIAASVVALVSKLWARRRMQNRRR